MNKVLSLLFTMFVSLLVPQTISAQVKFDFNASNHAVSASGVSDGDIIEAETYYMDGVTLTISPAAEGKGTPNRYWGTGNGPQLRMYSGTIMIDAGSKAITKITVGSGKWNASNMFNDVASADGNWEGSAANVILAIAGNTQMNYIEVTVSDSIPGSEPPIIPSDSLNVNPPDSLIVNPSDSLIVDPSDSIIVPPVDPNAKGQQNNPYLISDEDFLNMVMGLNTEDRPKSDIIYVRGYITNIDQVSPSYGNATFKIAAEKDKDAAIKLSIYRAKYLDNTNFTAEDQIGVFDEVVICGQIQWYKSEPEFIQGCYIYSLVKDSTAVIIDPQPIDENLVEIPQDQGEGLDGLARAELVLGDTCNIYTANEDLSVAFKMFDIDVKDCDYVVIKFAEPVAAGWNLAFWSKNDQSTVAVPAGAKEFKYVFADDEKCAIANDVLPQICMLTLWGAEKPLVAKVSGIYKHMAPSQRMVTLSELEKLCYSNDSTQCKLIFDDLLVAYQGVNHTYVTDGNRAMLLFGQSGLSTGDRISGEITGVAGLYYGTPEFWISLEDVNVSVLSSGNAVPRKPITAAELYANPSQWMNQYVVIDNVTFDSLYTTDDYFRTLEFHSDSITFTLFNLFNRRWAIDPTAVYTMEGVVDVNDGIIRIAPLAYTDLKEKLVLPDNAGTLERPFTVAEAVALASSLEVGQQTEQAYYVKGYISSVNYEFDEKYGNATFRISDMDSTGTSFYIYRTQYLENTMWMEGYTQVAVGDEVIVYGLFTNYKGTPETVSKQTYIYSLNGRTKCETIVEPIEGISYSWESPEGEPIQWGGTIAYVNGDGDRLNYAQTNYYTICLNGKKANVYDETASVNAGRMVITLDKPLNAGDTIAYTAFINKSVSKKASPYILFENGLAIEGEIFSDEANIYEEFLGVPTLKYSIVPEEAAGSKTITLTRSQSGTNLFITKLQVIENTHPIDNPTYAMGDVNTDGLVDVTDVVCIIDNILEKYCEKFDASLADVNGDNEINVTDVVTVIEAILGRIELARGAEMIDRSAYTAFQMDLTIPAGYVLESVSLTDIAKDSHTLAYNMLADGRCRVVVCSMNNEALPGAWDEVISLNLRGKGDAQVNIDRAVFVTIDGERHELMLNPTSIAEISNLKSQTSNLYDLQGRKIEKSVKGILIENGKKTIRK
jgi:hypothetical protein